MYYPSWALLGTKERYPPMEKFAFALVTATRKLKPYFQAYIVAVLTDKPLWQAMTNPEAARRMALWAIELSKFNVQYHSCIAIKGQVVVDFIAEFTNMEGSGHKSIPNGVFIWTDRLTGRYSTSFSRRG